MRKDRLRIYLLAFSFIFCAAGHSYGMNAPGSGGEDWYYNQKNHHWYYYDENRNVHTGWLYYEGDWYWFDESGQMVASGYYNIDGISYYFLTNGHMAQNQYMGLQYLDADGIHKEKQDIRVVGSENPTAEDRELITDDLLEVPRGWFAQFEKDGWQLMFYKKKEYFEAPDTDQGIYYVYHSVDLNYKKVKFTEAESVLQAFGEYVGFAAGLYEEDSTLMDRLWDEAVALNSVLNIPDYYSGNAQFYFGKLFAHYLDYQGRKEMESLSPRSCDLMVDILHMKDEDPQYYQRIKEEAQKKHQEQAEYLDELGGPGVAKKES
ncbi:MAG: hypothetical protein ACRDBO_02750 [Lachnospiraceae bacterium]